MSPTYRLRISKQAREDLVDVWQYIALDSFENADKFVDMIYDKCTELVSTPEMGRKRDDLILGLRSFPVKRYMIFYRIKKSYVEIVRVLSAYRDLSVLF